MNLLTVFIVCTCNKKCPYCPVRQWTHPLDYIHHPDDEALNLQHTEAGYPMPLRANGITNAALLPWLDAYIDPGEWIIELTGGEPGLYPEIETLVPELDKRGYTGVIKTNGTAPIPRSKNIQLVTAWHKDESFPALYDQILIIRNPDDCWQAKAEYCERNKIPYKTIRFGGVKEEIQFDPPCRFKGFCYLNSVGQLTPCAVRPVDINMHIFNMSAPPTGIIRHMCPKCKIVSDTEKFLPDFITAKLTEEAGMV